jgi:hypothetical protein
VSLNAYLQMCHEQLFKTSIILAALSTEVKEIAGSQPESQQPHELNTTPDRRRNVELQQTLMVAKKN